MQALTTTPTATLVNMVLVDVISMQKWRTMLCLLCASISFYMSTRQKQRQRKRSAMLSALAILLLSFLCEADVQLSLFKASAVWLLMLRAPGCSIALLLCLTYNVLDSNLQFLVCLHVNQYLCSGNYLLVHYYDGKPYDLNFRNLGGEGASTLDDGSHLITEGLNSLVGQLKGFFKKLIKLKEMSHSKVFLNNLKLNGGSFLSK